MDSAFKKLIYWSGHTHSLLGLAVHQLDAHWDHRHNTHIPCQTNRAPPTTHNNSITFNNKHTQTYCELFHQTIYKHATHITNRSIDRATHNIQGYNITLTTSQVQEAIKQRKNNKVLITKYQTPKYIGPLGLAFLTSMFKTALNKNNTSHMEVG